MASDHRILRIAAGIVLASVAVGAAVAEAPPVVQRKEFLTPVFLIAEKYKSMQGPSQSKRVTLLDSPVRELLWVTGFETTIVDAAGTTPLPQELLCHSSFDILPEIHNQALGLPARNFGRRVFLISQGQTAIRLPKGFAVPLASDEPIILGSQVLNHNLAEKDLDPPLKLRQKVVVEFVRDRDATTPFKPLFQAAADVLVSLEGHAAYVGTSDPGPLAHGSSCSSGEPAGGSLAGKQMMKDSLGQKFTGHWVVKPGRQVYRTLVTEPLGLRVDSTVHFIAVHLHPFAEWLELRDLTADRTVFRSTARNFEGRVGLADVDFLSSEEGIPVFKDHEYELVGAYNNTTSEDQDSMAVMYLYVLDKSFRRESVAFPTAH